MTKARETRVTKARENASDQGLVLSLIESGSFLLLVTEHHVQFILKTRQ